MGCLWRLFKFALFLVLLAFVLKAFAGRWAMGAYLQYRLGTEVAMETLRVDFINGQARLENVTVANPMVFPNGVMLRFSHIYLELNPAALLSGRMEFRKFEAQLEEARAVLTPGGINLYSIKPFQPRESGGNKVPLPSFYAPEINVSLGEGVLTDLRRTVPSEKVFDFRGKPAVWRDVKGLDRAVKLLIEEITRRMELQAAPVGAA